MGLLVDYRSHRRGAEAATALKLREEIIKAVERGAWIAKTRANPPVETGKLVQDISSEVDPDEPVGVFGNRLFYARFINTGTSKRTADPYLIRALDFLIGEYQRG